MTKSATLVTTRGKSGCQRRSRGARADEPEPGWTFDALAVAVTQRSSLSAEEPDHHAAAPRAGSDTSPAFSAALGLFASIVGDLSVDDHEGVIGEFVESSSILPADSSTP